MPRQSTPLAGQLDRVEIMAGLVTIQPQEATVLTEKLRKLLPANQVITAPQQLMAFSYDATGERYLPDVVVFAQTARDVEIAVESAVSAGVYIIARGSSSNLSGGTTPILGGMVLSLAQFKSHCEIDTISREATVAPGIVNAELQQILQSRGFFYPPDPASHRISTLGGNASENSGGPHCLKYGVTANHVLQMEVVLATGQRLLSPTVRDYRTGLDLTGFLVGSEGTMAVITQMTVNIAPQPDQTVTILAVFGSVEDALEDVSMIIARKILPATLELLDKRSIEVVEDFVHAGYPVGAGAVLLIEVDGTRAVVDEQVAEIQTLLEQGKAQKFRVAQSAEESEALWKGRRSHYGAAARIAPHLWIQDVTVPRPQLAGMMQEVIKIGERHGFDIFCAAHAGDGNLHPIITYNPADADEVSRMRSADREILQACVDRGGAITGEHGIGIDKLENLSLMYGEVELEVMGALKRAFDPLGLLNPLKVVRPSPSASVPPINAVAQRSPQATCSPHDGREVSEVVRDAARHGEKLSVGGSFSQWPRFGGAPDRLVNMRGLNRIVDLDAANMTLEVEAGALACDVARRLRTDGLDSAMLPYSGEQTIGGLVAANARHWRQSYLTGWRDVVLAAEWIDGRGRIMRYGRKTMKNVAGFDVTKLAVGSAGRLGVLSKITLRLRALAPSPLFGFAEAKNAAALLVLAMQLSGSPLRPDGLVLTRMRPGELRLWFSHESPGTKEVRANIGELCQRAGMEWHWRSSESGPEAWDQERSQTLNRALQHGWFAEGGVKPRDLSAVIDSVAPEASWIIYPATGAYEVYHWFGKPAPLPGLTRLCSPGVYWEEDQMAWQPVVRRIVQIFDPYEVFSKPQSWERGGI